MLAWQSQSIDYKLRLEKPASPQTPDVDPAHIVSIHTQIKALQIPLCQRVSIFFDLGVERILNGLSG